MSGFFQACAVSKRALETHGFSGRRLADDPDLVLSLLTVKRVAARANLGAGVISKGAHDAIEDACSALGDKDVREATFLADPFQGGGGIGINTNVNEAIAAYATHRGRAVALTDVNASQSTSDVVATALRLTIAGRLTTLETTVGRGAFLMAAKAREFEDVATAARTCLRDAMPASLGDLFQGYARLWNRAADDLRTSAQTMTCVNLGGTVIGNGQGASDEYRRQVHAALVAAYPGVTLRDNLADAAQNSDDLVRVMAAASRLAQANIKIGKDLRLLSSGPKTGFGELLVPSLIPGSSFFKNKSNPTLVETMIQAAFLVLGWQRSVDLCVENAELQLNVFDLQAGLLCLDALQTLDRVMMLMNDHGLPGLSADRDRCALLAKLVTEVRNDN